MDVLRTTCPTGLVFEAARSGEKLFISSNRAPAGLIFCASARSPAALSTEQKPTPRHYLSPPRPAYIQLADRVAQRCPRRPPPESSCLGKLSWCADH
ncbi:hypothetical protein PHLGIDRAFT_165351 [Phlebiopsis gigantea 11061_1 CR5-6]|uniref:Uncharacterized protein n=1 Tax=Phlebiopsis gigantea (strain 11061_1 CR5-6) TaxID=745531 RepID=A0A0C3RVA4_PHLG1|nr:hypothetical protein PHLGIDRAFT_165351 [Phlebiopsis gigantea 11061_1 CR5-6]